MRIQAWPSARDELAYPGTDRVSSSVYCAFGQRSVLQAADHADQCEPRFGADVVQLRLARKVMLRGLRGSWAALRIWETTASLLGVDGLSAIRTVCAF